jgi:signal recognition particle subunit SRP54
MLDGSRRKRIAKGSGRTIQEVNNLIKQFGEMRKLMRKMNQMNAPQQKLAKMMRKR